MNNQLKSYLIAAAVLLVGVLPVSSLSADRPNILLIVSEDNAPSLAATANHT